MDYELWDDSTVWDDDGLWGEDPTSGMVAFGSATTYQSRSVVQSSGLATFGSMTNSKTLSPSTGQLAFGSATRVLNPKETKGRVALGGSTTITVLRSSGVDVSVLSCCRSASETNTRVTFGSATWHASVKTDGDGLARYHPLWLDDSQVLAATLPILNQSALDIIHATGRDIAHHVDAVGFGAIQASVDGKMCELPEQFRTDRYYELSLGTIRDPQPEGLFPQDPLALQWEWSRGFTVTMLYRYRPIKQEQTLFSLSPALRFGITWFGELTVEIQLANGEKVQAWSSVRLPTEQWSHIAMTFDPGRSLVRVHLNGVPVITQELAAIGSVDACYIASWDNASLLYGEAQDVRIYDSILRTEFIDAEVDSYCADWIEVL
jgi:hypothetical protein